MRNTAFINIVKSGTSHKHLQYFLYKFRENSPLEFLFSINATNKRMKDNNQRWQKNIKKKFQDRRMRKNLNSQINIFWAEEWHAKCGTIHQGLSIERYVVALAQQGIINTRLKQNTDKTKAKQKIVIFCCKMGE